MEVIMLKKILLVVVASASLSFISTSFADEVVHWWYYPDKYKSDFEEWYPSHTTEWDTYYVHHKEHYTTFCASNPGWTFCTTK